MNKYLLLTLLILVSLWSFSSPQIAVQKNQNGIQNETVATTTLNTNLIATSTTATTTKKEIVKKPEPAPKKEMIVPIPLAPEPTPNFEKINETSRKAIVNILCTTKTSSLSPISGTGTIISPDGIILTNAHIGQYLLLKDVREKDFVECNIRTGSPAYPRYRVKLVYISPDWVRNNSKILKEESPKGTGENDFAFLKIISSIDGTPLPNFDYLISNVREVINVNEPVILVSYPAGFLGGLSILQGLSVASAITNISDIFTYGDKTVDLISVGGTILSQKGASGGAVVDKNGTLLGIISTSSEADSTSARDLRAITLAYINRSLQKEISLDLNTFLSGDTDSFSNNFLKNTAPDLIKIISDAINVTP